MDSITVFNLVLDDAHVDAAKGLSEDGWIFTIETCENMKKIERILKILFLT